MLVGSVLGLLGLAAGCSSTEAASPEPTPTTAAPTTQTTVAPTTTAPPTTAAPTTTTTAPPILRPPTPEQPLDTLIIGDSTAYEVGNAMLRANTDGLLAIDTGATSGNIPGIETVEPAFGRPAKWIELAQKGRYELGGVGLEVRVDAGLFGGQRGGGLAIGHVLLRFFLNNRTSSLYALEKESQ